MLKRQAIANANAVDNRYLKHNWWAAARAGRGFCQRQTATRRWQIVIKFSHLAEFKQSQLRAKSAERPQIVWVGKIGAEISIYTLFREKLDVVINGRLSSNIFKINNLYVFAIICYFFGEMCKTETTFCLYG